MMFVMVITAVMAYEQQAASAHCCSALLYMCLQVDYASDPVMMLKPQKEVIRRSFHYGIWLQHRRSAHQTQLHVMLHQLQVLVSVHATFVNQFHA